MPLRRASISIRPLGELDVDEALAAARERLVHCDEERSFAPREHRIEDLMSAEAVEPRSVGTMWRRMALRIAA